MIGLICLSFRPFDWPMITEKIELSEKVFIGPVIAGGDDTCVGMGVSNH